MADRNYPLPRPEDDPRFNRGLISDVSKALVRAGYPPLTAGDIGRLMGMLSGFIYSDEREASQ